MPDLAPNPVAAQVVALPDQGVPPSVASTFQAKPPDVQMTPPSMVGHGFGAQPPAPAPAQAPQIHPQVSHWAKLGAGFQSLVNPGHTEWTQGPNGPVPTQVPDKPGQMFRNILAGAIMGGAAGANGPNPGGSGWAGAGRGVQAVQQARQQQAQQAQEQAQQQFKNKQEADKAQREATAASEESMYKKAITAKAN